MMSLDFGSEMHTRHSFRDVNPRETYNSFTTRKLGVQMLNEQMMRKTFVHNNRITKLFINHERRQKRITIN